MKLSTSDRSPLSPTRWPDDAFRWWASLGVALLVFVGLLVPAFAAVMLFVVAHPAALRVDRAHPTLNWALLIVQFVSYAGGIAVLVLLLPVVARRSLRDLGLHAPRWSDLGWGVAGAIAMVVVVNAVSALQGSVAHVKPDEEAVEYVRNAHGSAVAGIVILACAAAPFTEELIFRGFVLNALRRYMPALAAVVISGLVFGLPHAIAPGHLQLGVVAPLAAGGIVLATIYYRSGSLVASMLSHALFNTLTVVAVLVFHQTT